MVINPSWWVPRSIAQRSYIPNILAGAAPLQGWMTNGPKPGEPASVDILEPLFGQLSFDLR